MLLGLSGGVDSALVLAVAVDALGRDAVRAVMLPSPYTRPISLEDARTMAGTLGVRYDEIPIEPVFGAFQDTLAAEFRGLPADAAEENIQARIRGTLLMALSNKFGSIVLTTGNKSEMAVGYATLYGDMAGGFAVLKDISKTMVYRLCRYRNALGRVIPERIITRAPSAELRADQVDQDSLPPYDALDGILEAYVEQDRSPAEIVAQGFAPTDVREGRAAHQDQRIQAAAGGGRHPRDAARLRQGLALPDHLGVDRVERPRLGPVHAMSGSANGWQGAPIKALDDAKTGCLGEESNAEWRPRASVPFGLLPQGPCNAHLDIA